jgi:phospholipid N-methyltransferase
MLLKHFVNIFKKIGFGMGSSPFLARRLVKVAGIEKNEKLTILELGGGSGIVTRAILASMGIDSTLATIEQDTNLAEKLRAIPDTRLTVIHDSAENILNHLNAGTVDVIVSTLPL